MISFTVKGQPVACERPRKTRGGRFYTPAKTQNYKKLVREICALTNPPKILSQVRINIDCYVKDLRSRDWDNMAKSICDALNGLAYHDDSQVTDAHVTKRLDRENPRVEVFISEDTTATDFVRKAKGK